MIPARIGSQRLKKKNLALINNKPLIEYVVQSAKTTNIFKKIYINSDDKIFNKIALKNKINFYIDKKLEWYEKPKMIKFLKKFPLSSSGKIDKNKLN